MAGTYWMPKAIAAISANRRPRALSLAMAQGGEGVEALRVRVWGGGGVIYGLWCTVEDMWSRAAGHTAACLCWSFFDFCCNAPLAYVAAVTRHDPYLASCCVWHSGLSSSDSVGNAGVKVRLPSTTQATRLQVGTVGLSWTTLK